MRDVLILLIHLVVTVVRLARPGGLRSVLAESLLVKHQLGIFDRGRKRAPNVRRRQRCQADPRRAQGSVGFDARCRSSGTRTG